MKFSKLAAAVSIFAVLAGPTVAQETPLIKKWIDGEVMADFPTVTYDGEPINLRYSTFIGEFPIDLSAFEILSKATNGKLTVTPYWGNSLANAQRGAFEAVSAGIADFGNCYVSNNPGGFTLTPGLQMPFAFESSMQGSAAAMELYKTHLKAEYEAQGVYLQRINTTRPANLLTKTPVRSLEDVKGKKLWLVGGDYIANVEEAIGAVPTQIPIPELYTAFQNNTIDGVPIHDAGVMFFNLSDIGKYRTETGLWAQSLEYCVNKERFDGLPDDLKAVFYHWSQLLNQAYAVLFYDQVSAIAVKNMTEAGIETIVLSDEEQARWQAAAVEVGEKFVAETGDPGKVLIDDIKVQAQKFGAMTESEITGALLKAPVPGIIDF